MAQVTVHEAKTHLSKLIKRALAGEEIIIARGRQPLVKLVVLPDIQPQRRLGGGAGVIEFMADEFDEPLAEMQEYMP